MSRPSDRLPLRLGRVVNGALTRQDSFQRSLKSYADVYALRLRSGQQVEVNLTAQGFRPQLTLTNPQGKKLAATDANPSPNGVRLFLTAVRAGQYRVSVSSGRPRQVGRYRLRSAIPADPAGNSPTAAFAIGSPASFTAQEFVGRSDRLDYYAFTLTESSRFSSEVRELSSSWVAMELYSDADRNGELEYMGTSGGGSTIARTLLPGTYFLKVELVNGAAAPYQLSLAAGAIAATRSFSSAFGYGLVDAAAAVALAAGSDLFRDVPFRDVPLNNPALPGLSYFWGLDRLKVPEVWEQGYRGNNVTIAVIDTGVDYFNPDLASSLWANADEIAGNRIDDDRNGFVDDVRGWDFVLGDGMPLDISDSAHGTRVAGILGAKNIAPIGVSGLQGRTLGIAPDAKIMPIRVLSDYDYLYDPVEVNDRVAAGIRYAVQNGADVINLSLTYDRGISSALPNAPIESALQFARQSGVVVVMAAGNSRQEGATRPAEPAYAAIRDLGIAVGAIDVAGRVADFSNPAGNQAIDFVVAPGVNIFSTDYESSTFTDGYSWDNGTSFATPYVAGVVALMLSANPNLTPAQVEEILTATANPTGIQV